MDADHRTGKGIFVGDWTEDEEVAFLKRVLEIQEEEAARKAARCTAWRCEGEGTIATGDFGMLCARHAAAASDSGGT